MISEITNLYERLEIDKTATDEDIKKAFREAAKKHHPDAGGKPDDFRAIQEAYDVLSDPEKRKGYDETGFWGAAFQYSVPEQEIIAIFNSAFANEMGAFSSRSTQDPVSFIKKQIAEKITVGHQNQETLDKKKEFILKLKQRIKRKKEAQGRDIFGRHIESLAASIDKAKEQNARSIGVFESAIKILDAYERGEVPEELAQGSMTGNGIQNFYAYSSSAFGGIGGLR